MLGWYVCNWEEWNLRDKVSINWSDETSFLICWLEERIGIAREIVRELDKIDFSL